MPKRLILDHAKHKYQNGRWIHSVSQSDIHEYMHCPESHRRNLLKLDPPMQNDAALLGSVFATYPQNRINGMSRERAESHCMNLLMYGSDKGRYPLYGWNSPYLNQVTFMNISHAGTILLAAIDVCEQELKNLPKGTIAEVEFKTKIVSNEYRDIYIEGASDLWLPDGSIQDWKLSGQEYNGRDKWKFERYNPQPPHYVLARSLIDNVAVFNKKFTFVNIHRDKMEVQRLELNLTRGDLEFHTRQIINMCKTIESVGFNHEWTLNPLDWWCSNKWCPAWKECRGKHIGEDPWGLVANMKKKLGT